MILINCNTQPLKFVCQICMDFTESKFVFNCNSWLCTSGCLKLIKNVQLLYLFTNQVSSMPFVVLYVLQINLTPQRWTHNYSSINSKNKYRQWTHKYWRCLSGECLYTTYIQRHWRGLIGFKVNSTSQAAFNIILHESNRNSF